QSSCGDVAWSATQPAVVPGLYPCRVVDLLVPLEVVLRGVGGHPAGEVGDVIEPLRRRRTHPLDQRVAPRAGPRLRVELGQHGGWTASTSRRRRVCTNAGTAPDAAANRPAGSGAAGSSGCDTQKIKRLRFCRVA